MGVTPLLIPLKVLKGKEGMENLAGQERIREISGELTKREMDVFELKVAGHTNNEIASMLIISAKTVENHVTNINSKLYTANRKEMFDLLFKGLPQQKKRALTEEWEEVVKKKLEYIDDLRSGGILKKSIEARKALDEELREMPLYYSFSKILKEYRGINLLHLISTLLELPLDTKVSNEIVIYLGFLEELAKSKPTSQELNGYYLHCHASNELIRYEHSFLLLPKQKWESFVTDKLLRQLSARSMINNTKVRLGVLRMISRCYAYLGNETQTLSYEDEGDHLIIKAGLVGTELELTMIEEKVYNHALLRKDDTFDLLIQADNLYKALTLENAPLPGRKVQILRSKVISYLLLDIENKDVLIKLYVSLDEKSKEYHYRYSEVVGPKLLEVGIELPDPLSLP